MGVIRFATYLRNTVPTAFQKSLNAAGTRVTVSNIPAASSYHNPTYAELPLLTASYDLNGILYKAWERSKNELPSNTTDELFISLFLKYVLAGIEFYLTTIRPVDYSFLAFDGVVPYAKMRQGRERRYRATLPVELLMSSSAAEQYRQRAQQQQQWNNSNSNNNAMDLLTDTTRDKIFLMTSEDHSMKPVGEYEEDVVTTTKEVYNRNQSGPEILVPEGWRAWLTPCDLQPFRWAGHTFLSVEHAVNWRLMCYLGLNDLAKLIPFSAEQVTANDHGEILKVHNGRSSSFVTAPAISLPDDASSTEEARAIQKKMVKEHEKVAKMNQYWDWATMDPEYFVSAFRTHFNHQIADTIRDKKDLYHRWTHGGLADEVYTEVMLAKCRQITKLGDLLLTTGNAQLHYNERMFDAASYALSSGKKHLKWLEKVRDELRSRDLTNTHNATVDDFYDPELSHYSSISTTTAGVLSVSKMQTNCFTPGTEIMQIVDDAVRELLTRLADEGKLSSEVRYSSYLCPGEGEHKIMDELRRNYPTPTTSTMTLHYANVTTARRNNNNANKPGVHAIHGLDADLFLLGLSHGMPNIVLFREERDSVIDVACPPTIATMVATIVSDGVTTTTTATTADKLFTVVDLECICAFLNVQHRMTASNFVLLLSFFGNDFLPRVPSLRLGEYEIMSELFTVYEQCCKRFDAFSLVRANGRTGRRMIDWGNVVKFIQLLMAEESRFLSTLLRHAVIRLHKEDVSVPKKEFIPAKDAYKLLLGARITRTELRNQRSKKMAITDPRAGEYHCNLTAKPSIEVSLPMFTDLWYKNAEIGDSSSEHASMVIAYFTGLAWVFHYYHEGISFVNTRWMYKYHHAPLLTTMMGHLQTHRSKIEEAETKDVLREMPDHLPHPYHQLLAVLPPASRNLLPESLREYLSEANRASPMTPLLCSTGSSTVRVDFNMHEFCREVTVLLPLPDPKIIEKIPLGRLTTALEVDMQQRYVNKFVPPSSPGNSNKRAREDDNNGGANKTARSENEPEQQKESAVASASETVVASVEKSQASSVFGAQNLALLKEETSQNVATSSDNASTAATTTTTTTTTIAINESKFDIAVRDALRTSNVGLVLDAIAERERYFVSNHRATSSMDLLCLSAKGISLSIKNGDKFFEVEPYRSLEAIPDWRHVLQMTFVGTFTLFRFPGEMYPECCNEIFGCQFTSMAHAHDALKLCLVGKMEAMKSLTIAGENGVSKLKTHMKVTTTVDAMFYTKTKVGSLKDKQKELLQHEFGPNFTKWMKTMYFSKALCVPDVCRVLILTADAGFVGLVGDSWALAETRKYLLEELKKRVVVVVVGDEKK